MINLLVKPLLRLRMYITTHGLFHWRFRMWLRRLGSEHHECPYRAGYPKDMFKIQLFDVWEVLPDGSRVCDFCGSLHPEDFERFVDEAIDSGKPYVFLLSDNKSKIYIHRPGIRNAGDGGIKFKVAHITDDEIGQRLEPKINQVLRSSRARYAPTTSSEL